MTRTNSNTNITHMFGNFVKENAVIKPVFKFILI